LVVGHRRIIAPLGPASKGSRSAYAWVGRTGKEAILRMIFEGRYRSANSMPKEVNVAASLPSTYSSTCISRT